MTKDSPCELGPYHHGVRRARSPSPPRMKTPSIGINDRPMLDPHIPQTKLEFVYSQLADIVIGLWKSSFSRIASLVQTDGDD